MTGSKVIAKNILKQNLNWQKAEFNFRRVFYIWKNARLDFANMFQYFKYDVLAITLKWIEP